MTFPTFRHDAIFCLACGAKITAATNAFDEDRPSPGDVAVCICCAAVAIYGDGLRLRPPTAEEVVEIVHSPEVIAVVASIRALLARGTSREHQGTIG